MTRHTFAVASDLHAFPPGHTSTSIGTLETPPAGAEDRTPLRTLIDFVSKFGLSADSLLCPGDLGDQADGHSQKYVWELLVELKSALGASRLIATAGNHDLDSRFITSEFDPEDSLRSLEPRFPLPDHGEAHNDAYWSKHFAICDMETVRLVVLNSSAYHGYGGSAGTDPEHNHGRVSPRTVSWLTSALQAEGYRSANVLLCHHHLQRFGGDSLDVSEMRGVQPLLEQLEGAAFGPWLVIHGHRHHPWLSYANGGSSSPTIFSAGSLSGAKWSLPVSNQFYLVTVDVEDDSSEQDVVKGTFQAWDWSVDHQWVPASKTSGLPHNGGFGYRESVRRSAMEALHVLVATDEPFLTWGEIKDQRPLLRYLLPRDEDYTLEYLRANLGVSVELDVEQELTQLAIGEAP